MVVVERELDERVEVVALHVHETRRALFCDFHSGLHVLDRLCLEWYVCFHACSFQFVFCPCFCVLKCTSQDGLAD